LCLFFFILYIKICCQRIHLANQKIIQNYIQVQNELNISFSKRKKGKINIGIYAYGLKNGGRARSTSLLINYFKNIKIFDLYLFSRRLKEDDEYKIPDNIKRTLVNQDLIIKIKKKKNTYSNISAIISYRNKMSEFFKIYKSNFLSAFRSV